MKNKDLFWSIIVVGLALGTAWAVRGRFGHEQGAAWAGAIGALSLIMVAKRNDWYQKAFKIAMAAAFGWGISGVMSYGVIVGYGRGTDYLNVCYGLLMLFVVGVLYGFLGGGFFGLALLHSKENRIPWLSIVTEMVAIGLLTYGVLINQLEWFMTPPRSEMWATCLGASIALAWFIASNRFHSVLKVALWSALGAGFGFAFGNFLQVMGTISNLEFNFWNVMEYSIGFFGGAGMAYGTFTSPWPKTEGASSKRSNVVSILFVTALVPFVVWDQSFVTQRFDFIVEAGGSQPMIFYFKLAAILAIVFVCAWLLWRNYSGKAQEAGIVAREFFILFTALYILLSFLVTGILVHPLEQYLYIINFLAILYLIPRTNGGFANDEFKLRRWMVAAVVSIAVIAVLAFIAINSHEGMRGSNVRFGNR